MTIALKTRGIAMLLLVALAAAPATLRAAETFEPVDAAREALASGRFTWYDSQRDTVAPIDLPKQRAPIRFEVPALGWLRWLAWGLLAVVLAALMAWIVWASRLDSVAGRRAVDGREDIVAADRVESLPFMAERSKRDLLGEARRHYAAGNYSEAIIYLFSYELVQLDKFALVELARGKTNRQYLREASLKPGVRPLVERTMLAFELVFFGRRELDRAGFEVCWNQLGELERLLAR